MLQHFIFSVNAVLPLFMVMIFGLVLRRLNIIDPTGAKQMNAVLFNFALPVRLFLDVYRSDFFALWDVQLISFTVGSLLIFFFISWFAGVKFMPTREMKGAFVQACFRSNYAIIGIPLVTSIMGFTPPAAVIVTTFVVPLFNILAVFILTFYSGEAVSTKKILVQTAVGLSKNPLIIGVLTGIVFSLASVPLPVVMESTLFYISDLSAPLALMVIGASMNFAKARERLSPTLIASGIKLILMPLLLLPFAFLAGISDEGIVILFVLYAAPTAISSYVMAYYMGSDEHLTANIILFTSMMSIFTYTLGVFALRMMGVV